MIFNKLPFCMILFIGGIVLAQSQKKGEAPLFMEHDDAWFTSDAGVEQMRKLVSWQLPSGGWMKDYKYEEFRKPNEKSDSGWLEGTYDNKATITEMRQIARVFRLTKKPEFLDSFNKGLGFIFTSQYPNGGWPQRYPIKESNYGHGITYNDNAMVNIMQLEYDVLHNPDYQIVDDEMRKKVQESLDKGLDCTLKCQVVVDGKPTVWAQQYDAVKMTPMKARAFELEGLASGESSAILVMLMGFENPSPEIQKAVHAGAAWFESVKITGKKLEKRDGDTFVVDDPAAEPLWSRFYEIGTNKPFFVGRDSVKRYDVSEIDKERRNGYAWLRPFWGADVAKKYAEWKLKYPA